MYNQISFSKHQPEKPETIQRQDVRPTERNIYTSSQSAYSHITLLNIYPQKCIDVYREFAIKVENGFDFKGSTFTQRIIHTHHTHWE